ncbi:MAG: hypothetical protein ABI227_00285 [Rhodanobacter sp.]
MTTQLPPQGPPEPDEMLPGEIELAALYRQLPQSEPSPALDAAILHAAAQALAPDEESPTVLRERRKAERERGDWVHPKQDAAPAAGPSSARGSRKRPRWLIALSSAATLVLAAGLVWHLRGLPPTVSAPTSADSAAPAQAAAPAPRAAPANAPIPPAEPAPPIPFRQPAASVIAEASPTPTVTTLRKPATDRQLAPASVESYAAGALPPPATDKVETRAAAPMVAPQVASDAAAKAAPPPAEAAPVAARMQTRMPLAPTAVAAAADIDTTSYASDTPAQELGKIRQLFALGHDDEARQRLSSFQLAHPRWDLPLDLQAQLRKP